jgi:hypothetical protein
MFYFVQGCLPLPLRSHTPNVVVSVFFNKNMDPYERVSVDKEGSVFYRKTLLLEGVFHRRISPEIELNLITRRQMRGCIPYNKCRSSFEQSFFFFLLDSEKQYWLFQVPRFFDLLRYLDKKKVRIKIRDNFFVLEDWKGKALMVLTFLSSRTFKEEYVQDVWDEMHRVEKYLQERVAPFDGLQKLFYQESPSMAKSESLCDYSYHGMRYFLYGKERHIEPFSLEEFGDYIVTYEPSILGKRKWTPLVWTTGGCAQNRGAGLGIFHKSIISTPLLTELRSYFPNK